MKKAITIVGNNANNLSISDGGRLKIRLFISLLRQEGYCVNIIDLHNWKRKIVRIFFMLQESFRRGDRIILMAGPNGCRKLIPIMFKIPFNKRSQFVFCPLGVGTIDSLIKDVSPEMANSFLKCENFLGINDDKMARLLKKFQYVVVQNEVIKRCYTTFYDLKNVYVLRNFRNIEPFFASKDMNKQFKIIYCSRVCESKGIVDLIEAVKIVNKKENTKIKLDIYGENQMNNKNMLQEYCDENISYKGVLNNSNVISTIKEYDLMCLPTKYHGEGTPGIVIESLISCTPVLISSYSQAKELVIDGYNGFIFKINSIDNLVKKIEYLSSNRDVICEASKNCFEYSKKYTYKENRKDFLKLLGGE